MKVITKHSIVVILDIATWAIPLYLPLHKGDFLEKKDDKIHKKVTKYAIQLKIIKFCNRKNNVIKLLKLALLLDGRFYKIELQNGWIL